jgi:hypothetical protein
VAKDLLTGGVQKDLGGLIPRPLWLSPGAIMLTLIKNFVVEKFFPQAVGLVQENISGGNRFPLFENDPA